MNSISHFNFSLALEELGWKFKDNADTTNRAIYIKNDGLGKYRLNLSDTKWSYAYHKHLGIINIEQIYEVSDSGSMTLRDLENSLDKMERLHNDLLDKNIPFVENYFKDERRAILNKEIREKSNLPELESYLAEILKEDQ